MKRFITNQGIRAVDNFGEQVTEKLISEIMTEHRNKLVMQVNAALENYVETRFHKFPTPSQVRFIRMLLEQLKDCRVYIEDLPEVLEEVEHTDVIVLPDEPFEQQIDEQIRRILTETNVSWEQYLK